MSTKLHGIKCLITLKKGNLSTPPSRNNVIDCIWTIGRWHGKQGLIRDSPTLWNNSQSATLISSQALPLPFCDIFFLTRSAIQEHHTLYNGQGSQGDCLYYNSNIIKVGIFPIIMENKDALIYSKLFHRLWVQIKNSFTLIPSNCNVFKSLLSLLDLKGEIKVFLWQKGPRWLN